jgi:dolichol kinase
LIALGALTLTFGFALAFLVSWLPRTQGSSTHLGRKVFHIAIFSGAVPAQLTLGFWGVVTYGSVLSLLILLAYWNRSRWGLFGLLSPASREGSSRRSFAVPFFSTVLGGLLGALLVGRFAVIGYLVCGWGDAAGEIVGKGWGRRTFNVPGRTGSTEPRTFEGSLGVWLFGTLGAGMAILLLGYPLPSALGVGILCGGAGAGAEAASGKDTDNFWTQIVPALMAWWVLV